MTSMLSRGEEQSCRPETCSIVRGVKRFGSAWQLVVIAYLLDGQLRFNELLRMGKNDGLNARTLSRTLKHLARYKMVSRQIVSSQPIAVQYSLTPQGRRLKSLLEVYRVLDEDKTLQNVVMVTN